MCEIPQKEQKQQKQKKQHLFTTHTWYSRQS